MDESKFHLMICLKRVQIAAQNWRWNWVIVDCGRQSCPDSPDAGIKVRSINARYSSFHSTAVPVDYRMVVGAPCVPCTVCTVSPFVVRAFIYSKMHRHFAILPLSTSDLHNSPCAVWHDRKSWDILLTFYPAVNKNKTNFLPCCGMAVQIAMCTVCGWIVSCTVIPKIFSRSSPTVQFKVITILWIYRHNWTLSFW